MATPMALLQALLLALTWLNAMAHSTTEPRCASSSTPHSTLTLMHIYGNCSPFRPPKQSSSWAETVMGMAANDEARLLYLSSLREKKTIVPIASGRQILQTATYLVRVNVGTPAQSLLMAMDTGNDAAWVPCSGCVGCSATLFDTTTSSTYKALGCNDVQCKQVPNPSCSIKATCSFNLTYGDSSFEATVSADTLNLATDAVPSYAFGCMHRVTGGSIPPQGLLGLGRGPMSLLSQTQNLYHSTFSYCLPSFRSLNFTGSLKLGTVGQPKRIKYTPLLKNPRRPTLYYVNLVGISVGRRLVQIPESALAFNAATGAGTIFDSGTVITRLVEPAYVPLRDEFRRRINGTVTTLGGFDTCYAVPIVAPAITLHFTGMNVTLPADNYLIHSTAGSITCLAMAAAPNNINSVLNVIANMQQQNHRILYDIPNGRVGVSRELCT